MAKYGQLVAFGAKTVHIWPMLKTVSEMQSELGARLRARRVALNLSQAEAAQRAGIAYRTWRRLETEGRASIEDMIKAAFVLRCQEALEALFPPPAAASLDDLLKQQASTKPPRSRVRAASRRS